MTFNIRKLKIQIQCKERERQRASPREHERIRLDLKRLKTALLIAQQTAAERRKAA